MDEVIPGLWIGDLPSALNVEKLRANGIYSILSAMRGRITIHETFVRHQILLDDTEDADILVHFLPSITFIQTELDKGRGVLVHCQAGMSRSVAIVAAYLMYSKDLDVEGALELIKKSHSNIAPNENFLLQLEIFHKASFKISRRDKTTRMFYMERTVEEMLNGDGTLPDTDMFAKFPRTPSDSAPVSPGGPRRRIRCKMCRQELAAREHMLDHGQLGPATPAAASPASSRRPSQHDPASRRPSIPQPRSRLGSSTDTRPRRPSLLSFGESLTMSPLESEQRENSPEKGDGETTTRPAVSPETPQGGQLKGSSDPRRPPMRPFAGLSRGLLESLSMSALETEDDSEGEPSPVTRSDSGTAPHGSQEPKPSDISLGALASIGRRMSDAVLASSAEPNGAVTPEQLQSALEGTNGVTSSQQVAGTVGVQPSTSPVPQTHFSSSADLSAQLYANPKQAVLRTGITPLSTPSKAASPVSPPILANLKCSGYFVEPMKWMEPFLESGQLAGKIICPNKKCGAKLGNYDWAGVCCSCREWVTPGFCIHRSKVDEIVG